MEGDKLNSPFIYDEIETPVTDLHLAKAPGEDGFTNEKVKNARVFVLPLFYVLFNDMLTSGDFPQGWCHVIIYPIHKKGCWSDPGYYRRISLLLSCISKVFTKLVNNRLSKWEKKN